MLAKGGLFMQRALGILLIVGGVYLTFKLLFAAWFLFLLLAAVLGIGSAVGAIGRWGAGLAVLCLLLAVPALLLKTLFATFAVLVGLVKLLPLLLVLLGIYLVVKAAK